MRGEERVLEHQCNMGLMGCGAEGVGRGQGILTFVGNITEFLLHEIPNKTPPRISQLKGRGLHLLCLATGALIAVQ